MAVIGTGLLIAGAVGGIVKGISGWNAKRKARKKQEAAE